MFPRGAHVVGLPAVLPGGRGEQTEGSRGQFEDPGSCLCLPRDDSAELPLSPSDPGDRSACHPVAATHQALTTWPRCPEKRPALQGAQGELDHLVHSTDGHWTPMPDRHCSWRRGCSRKNP